MRPETLVELFACKMRTRNDCANWKRLRNSSSQPNLLLLVSFSNCPLSGPAPALVFCERWILPVRRLARHHRHQREGGQQNRDKGETQHSHIVNLLHFHRVIEQTCRQGKTCSLQLFSKLGDDPGTAKAAFHLPRRPQTFLLKKENVLHADDIAERSRKFRNMRDPA